jgi:hypothetical protein
MGIENLDPYLYYQAPTEEQLNYEVLQKFTDLGLPSLTEEFYALDLEEFDYDKRPPEQLGLSYDDWRDQLLSSISGNEDLAEAIRILSSFDKSEEEAREALENSYLRRKVEERKADEEECKRLQPILYSQLDECFATFEYSIIKQPENPDVEELSVTTAYCVTIGLTRTRLQPEDNYPNHPYSYGLSYDYEFGGLKVYVSLEPFSKLTFFDPSYWKKPPLFEPTVEITHVEKGAKMAEILSSGMCSTLISELDVANLRAT